jgi:cell division protein ZapB
VLWRLYNLRLITRFLVAIHQGFIMQNELFSQLENKIENLIEEVELLRMEVTELKEAKEGLEAERQTTEDNLKRLLGKFDSLDAQA